MVFEREAAAAPILQGDSGTRHFSDACVREEHFAKVPDSSTSANPSKFAAIILCERSTLKRPADDTPIAARLTRS